MRGTDPWLGVWHRESGGALEAVSEVGIRDGWSEGLGGTQVKLCIPGPGLTCGRPGASWAFLSCPPEDECANGHHDCNETQNCHDRPHGYECSCKAGYTMDK